MKIIARLAVVLSLSALSPAFADIAPEDPPPRTTSCSLPDGRKIELGTLGPSWSLQCGPRPTKEGYVKMRVRPDKGDSFQLLITAMFPGGNTASLPDEKLKAMMDAAANGALQHAVETTAKVEPVGPGVRGYWATLTEKAPKPGELKFLTLANLLVKDSLLVVTILHREASVPDRATVRAMLASIRITP